MGEAAAPERLQRTMARAGLGSRRAVEDLIRQGRVTVDGRVAVLGDRVDPVHGSVEVDGAPLPAHPELRYVALNKPAGVTTTMRDRHARRTISGLLPAGPRIVPIGRLDRETEGLLLATNDGELANRLTHPRYGVEKEYLAEVRGPVSPRDLRRLVEGVALEDGPARARRARQVGRSRDRVALSLVMSEGRKREVRRMLAVVGHPVQRLVRVRVGPVRLGALKPGESRPLEPAEIAALYRVAKLGRAEPRPPAG